MDLVLGLLVGAVVGYSMACVFFINDSLEKDVLNEKQHVDHLSGTCPECGTKLRNFGNVNHCWCCGQRLRWDGEIL